MYWVFFFAIPGPNVGKKKEPASILQALKFPALLFMGELLNEKMLQCFRIKKKNEKKRKKEYWANAQIMNDNYIITRASIDNSKFYNFTERIIPCLNKGIFSSRTSWKNEVQASWRFVYRKILDTVQER